MPKRRIAQATLLSIAFLLPASQGASETFSEWVGREVDQRAGLAVKASENNGDGIKKEVAVISGATSTSNQQETPALASNSSSLVDTTSATDFLSLALDLADLTGSSEEGGAEDSTSGSVTASAYAFYTIAKETNPLDQEIYCNDTAQWLRWLNGTIGFEDDQGTDRVILGGVKMVVPFLDARNVCDPDAFDDLDDEIAAAAASYAEVEDDVAMALQRAIQVQQSAAPGTTLLDRAAGYEDGEFQNCLGQNKASLMAQDECHSGEPTDTPSPDAFFEWVRSRLSDEALNRILAAALVPAIQAESALRENVASAIREFEMQPRMALEFVTRQGDTLGDEYAVVGLIDMGFRPGLKAILNFGWERKERNGAENMEGGMAALGFEYTLPMRSLSLRRPPRVMLSADANWIEDGRDTYQGQLRLTIPVPGMDGLELPISVSAANRSELVNEAEVRGLVGFTLDTSRLFTALTGGAESLLLLGAP